MSPPFSIFATPRVVLADGLAESDFAANLAQVLPGNETPRQEQAIDANEICAQLNDRVTALVTCGRRADRERLVPCRSSLA